jgi:hypothetical protein
VRDRQAKPGGQGGHHDTATCSGCAAAAPGLLDQLQVDVLQRDKKASTDPDVLGEVAAALTGQGLVVMGTQLHYLIVYGYDIPDDAADDWISDRFGIWDPTNGSKRVVDLGDHDGQDLTLVFA